MEASVLLLGIDGGGTRCRARLAALAGEVLGEAEAGPANIRLGLAQSFAAVIHAAARCLGEAGLKREDMRRIVACLALAAQLVAAGARRLALGGGCAPFQKPWLGVQTKVRLVEPTGDALQGALILAREAAQSQAASAMAPSDAADHRR